MVSWVLNHGFTHTWACINHFTNLFDNSSGSPYPKPFPSFKPSLIVEWGLFVKACHVQNLESIRSDIDLFSSLASIRTSFGLESRMVVGMMCFNYFDLGDWIGNDYVKEMNQKVCLKQLGTKKNRKIAQIVSIKTPKRKEKKKRKECSLGKR